MPSEELVAARPRLQAPLMQGNFLSTSFRWDSICCRTNCWRRCCTVDRRTGAHVKVAREICEKLCSQVLAALLYTCHRASPIICFGLHAQLQHTQSSCVNVHFMTNLCCFLRHLYSRVLKELRLFHLAGQMSSAMFTKPNLDEARPDTSQQHARCMQLN